jgi:hypothetical protein
MIVSHPRHVCYCLCSQFLTCFLSKFRLLNIFMYVCNIYLEEQLYFFLNKIHHWHGVFKHICVWWWFMVSFILWHCSPMGAMVSAFLRFVDHTQWRNTVNRTSLDEWSIRHRDLYVTTHNTHNRQTSCPWRDLNPQSYQASCFRSLPWTAQPLGFAVDTLAEAYSKTDCENSPVYLCFMVYLFICLYEYTDHIACLILTII